MTTPCPCARRGRFPIGCAIALAAATLLLASCNDKAGTPPAAGKPSAPAAPPESPNAARALLVAFPDPPVNGVRESDEQYQRRMNTRMFNILGPYNLDRLFSDPEVLQTAWAKKQEHIGTIENTTAAADLRRRVRARPIEGTFYFHIEAAMDDPADSVVIANALTKQVLKSALESALLRSSDRRGLLNASRSELQTEITGLRKRRESLIVRNRLVGTDPAADPARLELNLLITRKVELDLKSAAENAPRAEPVAADDPFPSSEHDRQKAFIEKRISELTSELTQRQVAAAEVADIDRELSLRLTALDANRADLQKLEESEQRSDVELIASATNPSAPKP